MSVYIVRGGKEAIRYAAIIQNYTPLQSITRVIVQIQIE